MVPQSSDTAPPPSSVSEALSTSKVPWSSTMPFVPAVAVSPVQVIEHAVTSSVPPQLADSRPELQTSSSICSVPLLVAPSTPALLMSWPVLMSSVWPQTSALTTPQASLTRVRLSPPMVPAPEMAASLCSVEQPSLLSPTMAVPEPPSTTPPQPSSVTQPLITRSVPQSPEMSVMAPPLSKSMVPASASAASASTCTAPSTVSVWSLPSNSVVPSSDATTSIRPLSDVSSVPPQIVASESCTVSPQPIAEIVPQALSTVLSST